jgi:hypothetical protein
MAIVSTKRRVRHSFFPLWFFIVLPSFFLFLFFITRGITYPFVGYNAWNFNTYSLIARNYNTFGFFETKLAPIISVANTLQESPQYYLHHPQLLSVILSVFYKLFGETFWAGRLVVISFSIGSLILLTLLAFEIKGKQFAISVFVAASLIPAAAIFGRMIDMEPLVLFFTLVSFWSVVKYSATKKKRYVFALLSAVILGTLSDWPMTYVSVLLAIYCFNKQHKRLAISIVLTAAITESVFLGYVYVLLGGFSDLISAILQRSAGTLVSLPLWPFIWFATISLRLVIYFQPIFLASSLLYLLHALRRFKKGNAQDVDMFLVLFFLLGILYVLPFPEGSFGHAYWVYYFLPFVAFGSALFLEYLYSQKHIGILICVLIFSILYTVKAVDWKTKEVAVNIWRYELARAMTKQIPSYSTIAINKDSAVDPDLFQYAFRLNYTLAEPEAVLRAPSQRYYMYSCAFGCVASKTTHLTRTYFYKHIATNQGEAYLFDTTKRKQSIAPPPLAVQRVTLAVTTLPDSNSYFRQLYQKIMDILHLPQL